MRKVAASGNRVNRDTTISIDLDTVHTIRNRGFVSLSVEDARELILDLEYAIRFVEGV